MSLTISDVLCTPGQSGFFFDDQMAIRGGAPHEGFDYQGAPKTVGFSRIRQPGESVSVMLLLSDGDVALGDCVTVQYPGAGGRDPLFRSQDVIAIVNEHVRPQLIGASLQSFRSLATEIDSLLVDGKPLASAIRYGVTQAILDGVARSKRLTMAEVIRDEYDTGVTIAPVAMFAQSGDDRYANVEKMILKEVDVMPHGLINDVATKVGRDGAIFREFLQWVHDRILALRSRPDYSPLLHFDCYGTIGEAFHGDPVAIADYLGELADVAAPFQLRLEHPLDAGSREAQIVAMAGLRRELKERSINVQIVVDEWCNTLADIEAFVAGETADVIHVKMPDLGGINNTVEALLYVRAHGLRAYCGGSCTETDQSARVSANVAMACGADQVLAKPGMGVDEGLQIVGNEMTRVTALVALRERQGGWAKDQ
ncbi:MAG TPA: methylaspartate ammonia-lyase [Acidimicrobiales bacterium]|nr:methylaspartate ammonia-lyase [Acidimicrobiales bacterium]